jgi:hypothetical protein
MSILTDTVQALSLDEIRHDCLLCQIVRINK